MAFITSAVGGALVGGAINALGAGADRDQARNNQFSSDVNQAGANYVNAQNRAGEFFAGAQNNAAMAAYNAQIGAEMQNATNRTNVATGMFDTKYNIANMQAGYDKFQAEFGDIQDNIYNTMRTLSVSSKNAQIQEGLQENLNYEMQNSQQRFAELGINPSSGLYQASQMLLRNQTATEKVKQTRNTEEEIAGMKSNFINNEANQKYFSRAVDFQEGILTDGELGQIVTEADTSQYGAPAVSGYTPVEQTADSIAKPEKAKFLGIF